MDEEYIYQRTNEFDGRLTALEAIAAHVMYKAGIPLTQILSTRIISS